MATVYFISICCTYVSFFIDKHSFLQKRTLSSIMVVDNDHLFVHFNFSYIGGIFYMFTFIYIKNLVIKVVVNNFFILQIMFILYIKLLLYVNIDIHHFCCSYIRLVIISHLYLYFNLL